MWGFFLFLVLILKLVAQNKDGYFLGPDWVFSNDPNSTAYGLCFANPALKNMMP